MMTEDTMNVADRNRVTSIPELAKSVKEATEETVIEIERDHSKMTVNKT